MEYARKMILKPAESENKLPDVMVSQNDLAKVENSQSSRKKGNWIRDRAEERQRRLLKIILRLAAVNGYNSEFNIKLPNGQYLAGTDVISLVIYAISPGKHITGLEEFVNLLGEAKVPTELITNENVKALLASNPSKSSLQPQTTVTSNIQPRQRQAIKRPLVEYGDKEEPEEDKDEQPAVKKSRPTLKPVKRRQNDDIIIEEEPDDSLRQMPVLKRPSVLHINKNEPPKLKEELWDGEDSEPDE